MPSSVQLNKSFYSDSLVAFSGIIVSIVIILFLLKDVSLLFKAMVIGYIILVISEQTLYKFIVEGKIKINALLYLSPIILIVLMSSVILFEDETQDILALQLLATTLARFISGSTVLNPSNNLKKLYLGVTIYALIIVLVPDGLVWFVNPAVYIPWIKLGAVGAWVSTAITLYRLVNLQIETEHEALNQEQETRFYEHFFAITAHNIKNALLKIQTRLEIIKFLENKKDSTLLQHMTSLETVIEDTAHMVNLLLHNSYKRIHQEGPITIQGLAESIATTYLSNVQVKFVFTNAQSRLSPRETLALDVTLEVICSNALRHNSDTIIINAGSNTLSIKDNGDGIPKELLEKLGKEVVQSSSKTGTGSGLYLAKQLLQLVNWNIEIHSTIGEGTSIILNKVVDPS